MFSIRLVVDVLTARSYRLLTGVLAAQANSTIIILLRRSTVLGMVILTGKAPPPPPPPLASFGEYMSGQKRKRGDLIPEPPKFTPTVGSMRELWRSHKITSVDCSVQ